MNEKLKRCAWCATGGYPLTEDKQRHVVRCQCVCGDEHRREILCPARPPQSAAPSAHAPTSEE